VDTVDYWGDKVVIKIAPRYFHPTDVETLLGDPAKVLLGRVPEITVQQMCTETVGSDLAQAKQQHALLKKYGYEVSASVE